VPVWAKAAWNYNLSPLAEANGNEKTILLSLPSHLCDGLVKKPALALAKKTLLLIMTLFGTVNISKAISLIKFTDNITIPKSLLHLPHNSQGVPCFEQSN